MQQFVDTCAHRPDLMRVFLEVQVRACLEGVDMQGPGGIAVQKVADLLDVSRIELAHMRPVLRLRREQFNGRRRRTGGSGGGKAPPRRACAA